MRRRQRVAINQAKIRKECKLFGPLLEGARAFRQGVLRDGNPHMDHSGSRAAWNWGWDTAQEKQKEKENDNKQT